MLMKLFLSFTSLLFLFSSFLSVSAADTLENSLRSVSSRQLICCHGDSGRRQKVEVCSRFSRICWSRANHRDGSEVHPPPGPPVNEAVTRTSVQWEAPVQEVSKAEPLLSCLFDGHEQSVKCPEV